MMKTGIIIGTVLLILAGGICWRALQNKPENRAETDNRLDSVCAPCSRINNYPHGTLPEVR